MDGCKLVSIPNKELGKSYIPITYYNTNVMSLFYSTVFYPGATGSLVQLYTVLNRIRVTKHTR